MKELFFTLTNSLFGYAKRLVIFCAFLSIAVAEVAAGATTHKAELKAKIHSKSTGSGCVYIVENNTTKGPLCTGGEKEISISTSGENWSDSYEFTFTLTAQAGENCYFAGWSTSSDSYDILENSDEESYIRVIEGTEDGVSETLYAIFRRYYQATIYGYNAEEDQFHQTPLDNAGGVYKHGLEISSGEFEEQLYKLTFNHPIDDISKLEVTSEKFDCSIVEMDNDIVLKVKNKDKINGTVSENIKISVRGEWNDKKEEGGAVATLQFSVSNGAIYVTLNPAEGLRGTYTYTQTTTGEQSYSVTTSAIVKQMIASTDYSFRFTPKSQDDTKYQFEKWVIKDINGAVVRELSTANLSYTFSAGESITPVFTLVDRAIFIVKSEPTVKYVNLQEALDRAAELGKGQVVVVTVEDNRKGGRLEQGNYTIRGGVTLLVPGESGYNTMIGDLGESNFGDGANKNAFCTLTVDDNTTITVEDGNISLYAKLAYTVNGSSTREYVVSSEYGHIVLGKNSEIIVKKGGLYAFGYITGDATSHITMKSGTVVYEPFKITDWRGGSETFEWNGGSGTKSRVFPVGQYYVQSVEVPMTLEYGAKEVLSCCPQMSVVGSVPVNMSFIWNYDEDQCLFGLSPGTSITKSYNSATDRLKFEFNGSGLNSKVKIGSMNLKVKKSLVSVDVHSKDYVMPVQNNMDIEVKNVTIDVHYDLGLLPGSMMRVYDNAVINLQHPESGKFANVYVYDRGARKFEDGAGFWGPNKTVFIPMKYRPGGMKKTRTEADLVDARLIINGDMNITERGGLFTVKGSLADATTYQPEAIGGAQIMSEGSGKINVYHIDNTIKTTKQWQQGVGAKEISLTSPNLLLHNSLAAGAEEAYTSVTQTGVSYTYYQHDGTWRLPQAGVTGVKLYDASGNEIEKIVVTNPNVETVDGYLLATLEPFEGVLYDDTDFVVTLSGGNITQKENEAIVIENEKLKIPVQYTTQNIDGDHTTTLTIAKSSTAEFECNISVSLVGTEDYTPIFEVPASLNIYGRIGEATATALPIEYPAGNVIEATVGANALTTSNPKWEAIITGDGASLFTFQLGSTGNGLADAKVIFTPTNGTPTTATMKLKAVYTTDQNGVTKESTEHTIALIGTGLMIDNTLDFSHMGTVTVNSEPFKLLKNINSTGAITIETDPADPSAVLTITKDDDGNYTVAPKAMGSVTITVTQADTGAYVAKEITTTIAVVGDPRPLAEVSCIEDEASFKTLTANFNNVEYKDDAINFVSNEGVLSTWSAHFADKPGTLTFTPRGNGYWYIQESNDGVVWTELVWGTQLPKGKEQTIALNQRTRKLQIMYMSTSDDDKGSITGLCITPFAVHAETTKLYVPVVNGVVQSTSVAFIHSSENIDVSVAPLNVVGIDPTSITNPEIGKSTASILDGVLYNVYKTTVTLSGGANIPELNDGFELIATQGEATASVALATYAFPKPLQIVSDSWASDDAIANVNGYDESEHYYHYAIASKNVKWDAERKNVVFLNVENKEGDNKERQVVFGFDGLPDEVRFQSIATEWRIEESIDNVSWSEAKDNRNVEVADGGINTIVQPIAYTSKYVRITYTGKVETEVLMTGLVIKGSPSATPETYELKVAPSNTLNVHVMNLPSMKVRLANTDNFNLYYGSDETSWTQLTNDAVLSSEQYPYLAENKEGDITLKVEWTNSEDLVQDTYLEILNGENNQLLAEVHVVGNKSITIDNAKATGISTGIPNGYTYNKAKYTGYTHKPVDLSNTFDKDGKALFDYLIVYGETTTDDETTNITVPTSKGGSNALTPYYVYRRTDDGAGYSFVQMIENANTADKADVDDLMYEDENGTIAIDIIGSLKVYMTGFCPFATTGYTPNQEGVWLFRGYSAKQGEDPTELDIYLEDCHIFSRYKTENGKTMSKDDETVESFEGDVAIGSGAVFVFEDAQEPHKNMDNVVPFKVSIHTLGDNVLRSNYGNFFEIFSMRAAQISAPLHIHPQTADHVNGSKTELTFDDVWPTEVTVVDNYNYNYTDTKRTNGFLSLQKPNGNNNGPSIDLGNKHSIVNFKGGRVELQNAQIVSPNYKTTLAISHRSGKFGGDGGDETGFRLCLGIGTDDVGGTVNFYDGTTTVQPMTVKEEYRKYYLMDKDEQGNELTTTSCLRCPSNTYVYGGSQCFMRACSHVTSKGGAPKGLNKDGEEVVLGQYVYTINEWKTEGSEGSDDVIENNGLVSTMGFPSKVANNLSMTDCVNDEYGCASISPDANNKLYFWVPNGCGGVEAEKDAILKTWRACMTRIEAGHESYSGAIGGNVSIENTEEIQNLLYCKLDQDIYNVISAHTLNESGEKEYTYQAPVKVPGVAEDFAGGKYMFISPRKVGDDTPGDDLSHKIESTQGDEYKVNGKVYYITTATADVWMSFTAPFNVEKIWVVEPFDEGRLASTAKEEGKTLRESILLQQAKYNADFAAFFGVAMALGSEDNFETIFKDWRDWAFEQDKFTKLTDAEKIEDYHLRNKYELIPYDGTNADKSHFYLNIDGLNEEDEKLWEYIAQGNQEEIRPNWKVPAAPGKGEILLHQGETYSLLFPYCVGCWDMDGQTAKKREYWDYWSGKFLIFESTTATAQNPHIIKGEKYLEEEVLDGESDIKSGTASLRGNSTFTFMNTNKGNVYSYSAAPANEGFVGNTSGEPVDILPTQSFLLLSTSFDTDEEQISFISRSGMIRRPTREEGEDLGTGGHMPTLADGSDIFVLSTFEGINIAVTEPQNVSVYAANGALLFNGWVEKSVNVTLMNRGVYVVVGENVSVKAIY